MGKFVMEDEMNTKTSVITLLEELLNLLALRLRCCLVSGGRLSTVGSGTKLESEHILVFIQKLFEIHHILLITFTW